MIKIGFGNRIKPKAFEYIPRFYDPVKEEMQERLSKYQKSDNASTDIERTKLRIKTGIRMKYYGNPSARSSGVRKSNIRLLYIIFVLGLAAFVLLSSNKMVALIEAFSK